MCIIQETLVIRNGTCPTVERVTVAQRGLQRDYFGVRVMVRLEVSRNHGAERT